MAELSVIMRTIYILIFFLGATSLLSAQREDHQWIFNAWSTDDCSFSNFPKDCNASILDFNIDPPIFYQEISATLDMDWTHASFCDENGNLLLYSNGMSIHGPNHTPIIRGDTISYGPLWNNNTWPNENGDLRPTGFVGTDCAVFVPDPGDEDIILLERTTNPSNTSCAQHGNGRDWWLLQFSRDTLFSFLIDPTGINLDHITILPFSMDDLQSTSVFSDDGSKYAVHSIIEGRDPKGIVLTLFDFDRCSGDLLNPIQDTLSSESIFGTPGSAFSSSGQFLYINNTIHCFQYDMRANDIISSRDTIMIYDGQGAYSPTGNTLIPSTFGLMRKGPDNKIYLSQSGQGYHLHIIHEPDQPGELCRPQQSAIRLPTFHLGTIPSHNTLRLGPLDGSACDTLGIDNNPVSRFRYEQDTLDYLSFDFVNLSYFEPTRWEWDFGDGRTSPERFPFHAYAEDGIYEVCLTVSNQYSSDTSCGTLFLGVTSLDDHTQDRHITLFPNPVEDVTRVAIHDYLPQSAQIRFSNQQGQIVQTQSFEV